MSYYNQNQDNYGRHHHHHPNQNNYHHRKRHYDNSHSNYQSQSYHNNHPQNSNHGNSIGYYGPDQYEFSNHQYEHENYHNQNQDYPEHYYENSYPEKNKTKPSQSSSFSSHSSKSKNSKPDKKPEAKIYTNNRQMTENSNNLWNKRLFYDKNLKNLHTEWQPSDNGEFNYLKNVDAFGKVAVKGGETSFASADYESEKSASKTSKQYSHPLPSYWWRFFL